jgi:N-acetylmuramoyl-L-alanine amidase
MVNTGTKGTGSYVVRQGECLESIAARQGLFWETIWNDPKNMELKRARKDPFALLPGDRIHIQKKRLKEESRPTETRHRFRKKGTPSLLRLVILEDDEPRAHEPYTIEIDGKTLQGTTDANGRIQHRIRPDAKQARLLVGADQEDQEEYLLGLGRVDPIDEVTGIQTRLKNLGFYRGLVDGQAGPNTRSAIRRFQEKYDLQVTGDTDQETQAKLKELYGF